MIPAMPFIDWNKLIDNIGDTLNMPDLGKIINARGAAPPQAAGPVDGMPPASTGVSPSTSVGDLVSSAARGLGAGSPGGRVVR